MIPAAAYGELSAALAERGAQLLTTPSTYRAAHELPCWYAAFAGITPASTWIPCEPGLPPGLQTLARAVADLPPGPGIVKDYVKSRKHEWAEACYLPDLADTAAVHAVVSRFVELQEDSLAGGIVLRAFEELRRDVGEARVWWLDGEAVVTTGHPDTPGLRPAPVLDHIRSPVDQLGCRSITTDLARRGDGTWRVIEVGDGQVSDLPADADPAALLGPLLAPAATRVGCPAVPSKAAVVLPNWSTREPAEVVAMRSGRPSPLMSPTLMISG
ncbi:ATP-grasp domain-containing protein [Streptomyces polygonati]|uniref:ATP-grasp domain-containing protein n=1 Tax=Streptomyces polygonati TaxID=1617087 RepID=A0ABV8HUX2_9ACTN